MPKVSFTVSLGADRVISFDPERFPHLDHGYAVTSYSSQGKTMDRVLVNAETTESDLLVNQRMAYVAVSRARLDARIYTDSAAELSGALARRKDKTMALEALEQVRSGPINDNGTRNALSAHATQREDMFAIDAGGEGDESHSIARLKGRAILAESNVAVVQKRLTDFEKSKHLFSFEIDGEQWSLVRVDHQQRIRERQIDSSKRAISAYRMRLYGAINNPQVVWTSELQRKCCKSKRTDQRDARTTR